MAELESARQDLALTQATIQGLENVKDLIEDLERSVSIAES